MQSKLQMAQDGLNDLTESRSPEQREGFSLVRIFVGDEGLRSGWRLLIYAIAVVLLVWLSTAALNKLLGHERTHVETPGMAMLTEVFLLLAAFLPAIAAARLEHKPWGEYGLPRYKGAVRHFVLGLLLGFVALSSLLLLIHLFHGVYFAITGLRAAAVVRYAVLWALVFLLVGLAEEFLFRGYSLYTLARGIGFWPAAILLSALFGGIHLRNIGEDWIGALSAASIAVVFAFSLWRTGSLWYAVGMHAAWDWGESFFYGVPDSGFKSLGTLFNPQFAGSKWITGGTVGPEGSVFVFIVVIAIAVAIHLLYPKRQWHPSYLRVPDQHASREHQSTA